MKTLAVLSLACFAFAAPSAGQTKLQVAVFTASAEGFLVNSVLVSGARDAVLIDAAFTRQDALALVDSIKARRKNLTTVYVTHGHPDHYFGLEVIKSAFPNARFVAQPATLALIQRSWKAKVDQWKPTYQNSITSTPVIPTALDGKPLAIEGQTLEITGPVQGDDDENSYVWIPSLKTVVAGDIVYSGVHVWTAETDSAARTRWIAVLDRITALNPIAVVPGHQVAGTGTPPSSVAFTREYLNAFDEAVASSTTAEQVQEKMKAKYPDLALEIILKIGSEAALARH
jgi:glyoxylase-like metal-dependent hydrolase (beta-lactamase superfamily II)